MANVPTLMHHDIYLIPNLQSRRVAKEKQLERTVERGARMWVENEDVSVDDAVWILTGEIVGVLWQ